MIKRASKRIPPRPYGMVEGLYRRELLKVRSVKKIEECVPVEEIKNLKTCDEACLDIN